MKLRQDRVLGALLGMGIGDALGMPVEGWTRERVTERFGRIEQYQPRTWDDGVRLAPGEFTDESEGVLCIVESFTASTGQIDPENIRARLEILARGEARRWMNPETLIAIETDPGAGPLASRLTGDVAARGIPLGLIAAGRENDGPAYIDAFAGMLAAMTHPDPAAAAAVATVAEALRVIALGEALPADLPGHLEDVAFARQFVEPLLETYREGISSDDYDDLAAQIGFGNGATEVISTAILAAATSQNFPEGVFMAASQGGAADARGAITGALLGAAYGTAGIPQNLIDGLEGRMYIMLAAPWFFQTIQLGTASLGFGESDK